MNQMKQKNYKKNFVVKKYVKKSRVLTSLLRHKRLYKCKPSLLNCKYALISQYLHNFNFKICLRIRSNNVFCTLRDLKENTILLNMSSGKYKMQTSKKRLKYNSKIILEHFFKDIQKYLQKKKNILLELISPIKIRKRTIKYIKNTFNKKNLILYTNEKKCFNGCRVAKKRKKKRARVRIFK